LAEGKLLYSGKILGSIVQLNSIQLKFISVLTQQSEGQSQEQHKLHTTIIIIIIIIIIIY